MVLRHALKQYYNFPINYIIYWGSAKNYILKKQQIKQPTDLEHLSNFKIKQYLPTIQIH